jgi:hypothetical protein
MPRDILPPRGLGNLRTWGERGKPKVLPSKAYLRISFLELERARHDQEIAAAQQRLAAMTSRCRDIDTEKQAILAGLNDPAPAPASATATTSADPRGRGRFKLSY